MSTSMDLEASAVVGLPRQALNTLCTSLYRDLGGNAAAYLQEAGYNAAIYEVFERWLAGHSAVTPDAITADQFPAHASDFFSSLGWGSMVLGSLGSVATIDSDDWAEANPASAMEYPACYFTAGMLADFFGRLSGVPVAALEVECRSASGERCRFLVGSAETIQRVYDGFSEGVGYADSVGA